MINNNGGQHTVLDWITRITPTMRGPVSPRTSVKPAQISLICA